MKSKLTTMLAFALAAFAGAALAQSNVVTIYAADGLHDGNPSWFGDQFAAFTKATGIKVQYIEAGSSGVADRIAKEKSNTQADVLVTLPPFMQRAAADGLLQPYMPAGADKLTALVNKGEIYVANGDLQMNLAQMRNNPNVQVFFPAGPNGKRSVFALPYFIGLVAGAPHADNGKKLIDFLMSQEAQSTISSVAQGFPVRSDVHPSDENFKKLNAMLEGVEIWSPDWSKVLSDLQADVAAYNKAISGN